LQWLSKGLEVGWAQEVWGRKSPAGSRGRARWVSGGEAPRSQICIYNLQWTNAFSWCVHRRYTVYLQAHAESATYPHLYSSKKLFKFVQISRSTLAEVGWTRAHPCPTVATPLFVCQFNIGKLNNFTRNLVIVKFKDFKSLYIYSDY